MSSDPQLRLFAPPNEVEVAASDDAAVHSCAVPKAAAASVALEAGAELSAERSIAAKSCPPRNHHVVAPAHPQVEERFLSVQDVARRYAISAQTVWRHTKNNSAFPKPIKILNGSTRWRITDILAYEISRQDVR